MVLILVTSGIFFPPDFSVILDNGDAESRLPEWLFPSGSIRAFAYKSITFVKQLQAFCLPVSTRTRDLERLASST
jgi:hypothetical protein